MDDSVAWAMSWLADLLGSDGPGMTRPVVVHDRQCAGLATADLPEQLRELRRPIADGVPKNGRYAVVYERRCNDGDCVWLEAAEYTFGMFGTRALFVQPVRRTSTGALVADGEPRELTEGDVAEPSRPGRGVTARAVLGSVGPGVRSGLDALRRSGGITRRSLRGRLAGAPTALIVALWVGVLLLGVLSAVSLTGIASSSRAAARSKVAEHATAQTVAEHSAGQAVAVAPGLAANPPTPGPDASQGPATGDLGLSVPISRPACDGGYGVIVANATRPGAYRHEIGEFLARFSGASYLLAEQACSSLRAHTEAGDSIYAVYYGPYPALGNACATRGRIGGGSYVRKLDNGPESSLIITC